MRTWSRLVPTSSWSCRSVQGKPHEGPALSLMVVYLFVFLFEKPLKSRKGAFIVMLVFGGIAGGLMAYMTTGLIRF